MNFNLIKDVTVTKVAATIVGVAMVSGLALAFAAERAHAVTTAELVELLIQLNIIPADKAADARAAVQSSGTTTGGSATGGSCSFTFTRDLKVGSTGTEVMNLQKFLNMSADTMVAASGAGSTGMETSYFGPATKAAVAKFQTKYAADILAPLGLTMGTGNFGVSTRAKANAVCTTGTPSVPTVPGLPTAPGGTGTTTTGGGVTLSGGEASLEEFNLLNSPSSADVAEGDDLVKVAGWEFDVKDADVALNRVDVRFEETSSATNSTDPWDYFDSVALYLGDEKLAEVDASDESDWDDLTGAAYEIRFTGLSKKISEDDTAKLYVAVSSLSNIDDADEDATWSVWIPNDGVRARDGAGIDQYVGDADLVASATEERTFDIDTPLEGDELKVALASSNPPASTIRVDDEDETNDQTVLVFTLEAEGHDIQIDSLPLTLATTSLQSINDLISDVSLEVDGESVGDIEGNFSTAVVDGLLTFTFDNDELVIKKDEKVTVKVLVDFLGSTGNYGAGGTTTLTASITSAQADAITGEGGDDLDSDHISGSATGEAQTLLTSGIFAEIVSITPTRTAGDNNANDIGTFVFKVDVQAVDTTAYISATTSSATTTAGTFVYHIEDGNGTTISDVTGGLIGTSTDSTISSALSSTATTESSAYRVNDGDSETFTFTVTLNPNATGYYRVELDTINFGTTAASAFGSTHTAAPNEDFESDNLYLVR